MNKIIIMLILIILSCKDNMISINKRQNLLLQEKWERLTINKNDTIIYRPCDADNATIKFSDNKVIINYGQEEITYDIKDKNQRGNNINFILSPEINFNYTIISNQLLRVRIKETEYIYTTFHNSKYRKVEQSIRDCTEEDEIYEDIIKTSKELAKEWEGIYYYNPFDDKDSIGSYYIDIEESKTNYGYSGGDGHFLHRSLDLTQIKDTLFIKDSSLILAKLFKKDNQFFVKSDLIKDRKNKINNTSGIFIFKYAKSANDVPD